VEGCGRGASPLIIGRGEWHERLEEELAACGLAEAAFLFSSGYAANVGCITALAGKSDVIFSDAKNHASIIDGCRLSGATITIFPHGDTSALAALAKDAHRFRRRLIVTDSVFSMDGDCAPLDDYAAIAEQHDCMLLVDEAHATGIFGAEGRGLAEQLHVEDACAVRVGTLSKALGSSGGFVVGPQHVIDWLANRARSYFFSTAPPDACAAAAMEALEIIRRQPERRRRLLERAAELRDVCRAHGWNVGSSSSQIIPIYVGDPRRTMDLAARLRSEGLLVPGIRPPSVPHGESLLRISLCYHHEWEHCTALMDALQRAASSVD